MLSAGVRGEFADKDIESAKDAIAADVKARSADNLEEARCFREARIRVVADGYSFAMPGHL